MKRTVTKNCKDCGIEYTKFLRNTSGKPNLFCSKKCYFSNRRKINADSFWSKVKKTKTCWLWTSYVGKNGYGSYGKNNRSITPHRFVFTLIGKEIPKGMCVDHKCRVRHCVRPSHLRIVTRAVNCMENSISPVALNKKKTKCKNGHKFTTKNTYIKINNKTKNIGRLCRKCTLTKNKVWRVSNAYK